MKKDRMVNVSKLINQLPNAKVVMERMCEDSGTNGQSAKQHDALSNGSQFIDSVQRYCPECQTVTVDAHGVSAKKCCPRCESILKYLCSKCNSSHYTTSSDMCRHRKTCDQIGNDVFFADSKGISMGITSSQIKNLESNKRDPSDFLIEKTNIDYSREIIRYCSRCNKIEENCPKWVNKVCRNCNHYLLYQCKKCSAQYKDSRTLIRHMESKCYPRQYKCNQCDFTKPWWERVRRHIDSVHRVEKIHCPRCDRVSKNKEALRQHLMYCGSELKFNCDCCNFKSKYKRSLQYHMKSAHGN